MRIARVTCLLTTTIILARAAGHDTALMGDINIQLHCYKRSKNKMMAAFELEKLAVTLSKLHYSGLRETCNF